MFYVGFVVVLLVCVWFICLFAGFVLYIVFHLFVQAGYRDLINKRFDDGESAIPYLATVLSDLTFVEEGNKNTLADGLIHFYKFHLIGKQLQSVGEMQKRTSFCLFIIIMMIMIIIIIIFFFCCFFF